MSKAIDKVYERISATYPQLNQHARTYAEAYHKDDLRECGRLLQASYDEIDAMYSNIRQVIDHAKDNYGGGEQ